MIDAKHPMVPFGGETENGFRKFCAKLRDKGLKCSSGGTGPAQVAVAIKTAIAALEGQVVPQSVKLPLAIVEDPNFKDGENYYSDQSDNFFVGNSFPTCGINFTAQEIMGQTEGEPVVIERRSVAATVARPLGLPRGAGLCSSRDGNGARPRRSFAWRACRSAMAASARSRRPISRSRAGRDPRHPRRERRRQVDADQDHGRRRGAGRGTHDARRRARSRSPRPPRPIAPASSASSRNCRSSPTCRSPTTSSISNPPRRLRHDRPARAAPHRRRGARARRRRRHPSAGARQGPAAVAPADGRDRQGAGARAAHPHPRRGDLGADRGRRRARCSSC